MKVKINEEKFSGKFWAIVDNAMSLYSEKVENQMSALDKGFELDLDLGGSLFTDEEDKEILGVADWSDDELYEAVCDEIKEAFMTVMDIYIREGVRIRTETSIDTNTFRFDLEADDFWYIWKNNKKN